MSAFPWGQVSAGTIVVFVVWLILTGRLVPKAILQEVKEQRDKYKESWENGLESNQELVAQVRDLTEMGKTSETLLRAILDRRHGEPAKDRVT